MFDEARSGKGEEAGDAAEPDKRERAQSKSNVQSRSKQTKHRTSHVTTTRFGAASRRQLSGNAIAMIDPALRLRRAIHAYDPLLVARLLKSHPHLLHNPDASPTGLSNTSLHLAASLGSPTNNRPLPIVQVLLSAGHESDGVSLNEDHQTPLMLAARAGFTEAVHLLCTTCPHSIPKRDIRGRDAIIFASEGGHDTCLQILLTFAPGGPDECLRHKDIDGNTALHYASSNGHLLVLRTLLAAGADSEVRNAWSWTPVAYSATVQAEVYFKGLVGEVERRRQARKMAEERGTGGGVRLVGDGEE